MASQRILVCWIEDQLDEFIDGGWDVLRAEFQKQDRELERSQPGEAKTLDAAEKMLQTFHTSAEPKPDVILLDLMLPQDDEDIRNKRVDLDAGYLIWFEIRCLKKWPSIAEIPIIVITARGRPEYMDQMLADAKTRWLSKPADPATVAVTVVELVTPSAAKQEKPAESRQTGGLAQDPVG